MELASRKTILASGPPTASTGRTYGCKRSDQTRKNSCGTGAVHICEIFRGTHWPVEVARLYGTRVAENHLGQRSSDRINRPDIWMQAIRSDQKKLLWHGGRPHMGPGVRRDDAVGSVG